jgi:creatinine amidohydrolase
LPAEYRKTFEALPAVFMPLGTVEWHGEHNALGLDALKAHALCARAAQKAGGGVVHPPLYGGMGGLDEPATVIIEPELAWENYLLRPWLEQLCYEFHRLGFRAIILLTGHYGHNQQLVVRETAARMTERLQIPVLGTPEYWLAHDEGYLGDHAGVGETSLLWHLHPELVAINRLKNDPDYGATPYIEENSSQELGQRYAECITDRLAQLVTRMVQWSVEEREAFVRAERAIIRAQVKGWRLTKDQWAAWRHIGERNLTQYGAFLVKEQFAEIEALAEQLL